MPLPEIFLVGDKTDVMRFQHCWSSSGFNTVSTPSRDPKKECIKKSASVEKDS